MCVQITVQEMKTVVFTGFRDAALQKKVEDQGGRVTSAVSGKTDVLVVSGSKGVGSAKAAKARALGVRVATREDFEKGFLSLFDRIFFKQSEKTPAPTGQTCYLNLDNGGKTFRSCFNSRRFWVTQRETSSCLRPRTRASSSARARKTK